MDRFSYKIVYLCLKLRNSDIFYPLYLAVKLVLDFENLLKKFQSIILIAPEFLVFHRTRVLEKKYIILEVFKN